MVRFLHISIIFTKLYIPIYEIVKKRNYKNNYPASKTYACERKSQQKGECVHGEIRPSRSRCSVVAEISSEARPQQGAPHPDSSAGLLFCACSSPASPR